MHVIYTWSEGALCVHDMAGDMAGDMAVPAVTGFWGKLVPDYTHNYTHEGTVMEHWLGGHWECALLAHCWLKTMSNAWETFGGPG